MSGGAVPDGGRPEPPGGPEVALPGIAARRALVTGGSRGIGRETAVLLARCGARIGIGYRSDAEAAAETLRRIEAFGGGSAAWAEAADLAGEEGVEALFGRADREFGGGLDILVGNAGVWNRTAVEVASLSLPEWREMLDANLTSIFLCARAAARRMRSGGRMVLVSSTAAQRGEAGHAHYAASKGAIQSLVKSLAVELGPAGIAVNAVAPGWVDTDMSAAAIAADRERIEAEIPLRRVASAADVAAPVAFLASDLARHITGEVLNVNGGAVRCG